MQYAKKEKKTWISVVNQGKNPPECQTHMHNIYSHSPVCENTLLLIAMLTMQVPFTTTPVSYHPNQATLFMYTPISHGRI